MLLDIEGKIPIARDGVTLLNKSPSLTFRPEDFLAKAGKCPHGHYSSEAPQLFAHCQQCRPGADHARVCILLENWDAVVVNESIKKEGALEAAQGRM